MKNTHYANLADRAREEVRLEERAAIAEYLEQFATREKELGEHYAKSSVANHEYTADVLELAIEGIRDGAHLDDVNREGG